MSRAKDEDAVQAFLRRVRQANNNGSREIRMTMTEAVDLSMALAVLLNRDRQNSGQPLGLAGKIRIDGGQA